MRRFYVKTRVPVRYPGEGNVEAITALIPEQEPEYTGEYTAVKDGDIFELGERTLTALHTPGHSEGSVCYLDSHCLLYTSRCV